MKLTQDVFRTPKCPMLFSVLIGMGLQYSIVLVIFLLVANLGMQMTVHMREYLYLMFLALSALTGSIGGFMSSRLYVFFNRTGWKRHAALTTLLVPGIAILALAVLTMAEQAELTRFGEYRSSEFDKVYLVWAIFDMPNVAAGCWLGYRAEKIAVPVKATRFRRGVPSLRQMPFYTHAWFTILLGSLLVSACIVAEAYYLMTQMWRHLYYFMYLYLTIGFVIMGYVASTASVVQTYLALSAGDYNWWWRSYLMGFTAGVHVFIVCFNFYFFLEEGSTASTKLSYVVWTVLLCLLTGLVCGFCAFAGSFYFVKRIYTEA